MLIIRLERPEDANQVRQVHELAFRQPMETDLVERVQQACGDSLSLVAEDNAIVAHILFTPVTIHGPRRRVVGMGLAPIAVRPDRQRQGIGSKLVRRGWTSFVTAVVSIRCCGRSSGVLSALRVRAGLAERSGMSVERRSG